MMKHSYKHKQNNVPGFPQKVMLLPFCIFLVCMAVLITSPVQAGTYSAASGKEGLTLKSYAEVESEALYLSDIFEGIRSYEDSALGRAPKPGEQFELNAVLLKRIAKVYNLSWRPESIGSTVIVQRTASVIPAQAIRDSLESRLRSVGVDGNFHIKPYTEIPEMILPKRFGKSFEISSLDFDPATDRFKATIVAPSTKEMHKKVTFSGTIERMIDVPVLKKSMRNGPIIINSDIQMVPMRIRSLNDDVIVDKQKVLGMTPDRFLVANKPIRKRDVSTPTLVERGQRITLIHEQGPMKLSALGKSMENGTKGQIIRVVNLDSNTSIRAEVIGSGVAKVF